MIALRRNIAERSIRHPAGLEPGPALGVISCLLLAACSTDLSDPVALIDPVTYDVSANQSHEISAELVRGSNFLAHATQEGIDVALALVTPAGEVITVSSPIERDGDETLYHPIGATGTYTLRIFSADHDRAAGRSTLTIYDLPVDTKADRRRTQAERLMTEGAVKNYAAVRSNDAEAKDQLRKAALTDYRAAADTWRSLRDLARDAQARYCMGELHYEIGEWHKAANAAEHAAGLLRGTEKSRMYARALHLQGQALAETESRPDLDYAVEIIRDAISIHEKERDTYNAAISLNTLGILEYQQGDLRTARETFIQAGEMHEQIGEFSEAVKTYNNVAKLSELLGELRRAIGMYQKTLLLADSIGLDLRRADFLENSADAHAILGNMQEALVRYYEAAEVFKEGGERPGEARALDGIGFVYYRLGNWELAIEFFEKSLGIRSNIDTGEIRPVIETYTHHGNALRQLGQVDAAIASHNKALELTGRDAERAVAHLELARDYSAIDNFGEARKHAEQAFTLPGTPVVHAYAATERGILLIDEAPESALSELEHALSLHSELSLEHGRAETLAAIARAEQKLARPAAALEHANEALSLVEELRRRTGNPGLLYTYTGLQWPTYELVIDLLMNLHSTAANGNPAYRSQYETRALEVSERARAQTLIELLYEREARPTQSVDQELWARHRSLRHELAEEQFRQSQTSGVSKSDNNNRITSLITELDVTEAKLHALNPYSESLAETRSFSVADMQSILGSDSDTLLLEFFLGEEASFVWTVTRETVVSWRLPARHVVEDLVRQTYTELRTPSSGNNVHSYQALRELSETLLEPVQDYLSTSRIVVVPDGALHYIPFGVLLIPGQDRHLLEQAEIVTLPSAGVLAAQRNTHREREPPAHAVAIVADPIFDSRDPRLANKSQTTDSTSNRIASEKTGRKPPLMRKRALARLPYSGQEVAAIVKLVGNDEEVLSLIGFDATRDNFMSAPLGDYRVLHIASHGLIDSVQPELSSIALSAFDTRGNPIPSLVQLSDIQELELNSDVVVLSACDTALGRQVRGEGLVGLINAFLYAGSQGVVATDWPVQDKATAKLMEYFYKDLFHNNKSPASALRTAQLAIAAEVETRDPYFWAPFVYQGDWLDTRTAISSERRAVVATDVTNEE